MYDLQLNLQPGRPDHDLLRIGRDCLTNFTWLGIADWARWDGERNVRHWPSRRPLLQRSRAVERVTV